MALKLPSPNSSLASGDTWISDSSPGADSPIISLLFESWSVALTHDIALIIDKTIKNSTNRLMLLFLIICFSPLIVIKYIIIVAKYIYLNVY